MLCDLVPGGHPKEISAAQATRILEQASPSGAADRARSELAAEFLQDMRRLDAQLRDTRKKLAAAVRASGTTLTGLFGVGPVIAGTIVGDIADVYRFPGRGHFAAYDGTAPVEVSSGNRKIHRLSLHGNRRINHAIHMAAITQIRHKHSDGRAYYDKKIAEGKTVLDGCALVEGLAWDGPDRTFCNAGASRCSPILSGGQRSGRLRAVPPSARGAPGGSARPPASRLSPPATGSSPKLPRVNSPATAL